MEATHWGNVASRVMRAAKSIPFFIRLSCSLVKNRPIILSLKTKTEPPCDNITNTFLRKFFPSRTRFFILLFCFFSAHCPPPPFVMGRCGTGKAGEGASGKRVFLYFPQHPPLPACSNLPHRLEFFVEHPSLPVSQAFNADEKERLTKM